MILNEINHKMAMYKDCTLSEIAMVGFAVFLALFVFFSLISALLSGYFLPGLVIALLLLWHSTKFALGRLQRLKYGKPHGYYLQLLQRKLQRYALFSSLLKLSYVQRLGKWSVRRR